MKANNKLTATEWSYFLKQPKDLNQYPNLIKIYHDETNCKAVATNAYMLLTTASEYDPDKAGQSTTAKGEIIDNITAKYPNYQKLFPDPTKWHIQINCTDLFKQIEQAAKVNGFDKIKTTDHSNVIKITWNNGAEYVYFAIMQLLAISAVSKKLGFKTLALRDDCTAGHFSSGDGNDVLLMPMNIYKNKNIVCELDLDVLP